MITNEGGTGSITVYSRTANGDVAPLRTVMGALTGLEKPQGVVVDATNDEIVVAEEGLATSAVLVFSRTANGNVAPIRTIAGAATGLEEATGVAVDREKHENIVANGTPSVTV